MGMRPMNPDEQWCFDRLVAWEARFNAIMDMYDRTSAQPYIAADRVEQARRLYTTLKQDLFAEHKKLTSSPEERPAARERWYDRTIEKSVAQLRAPMTSRPETWHTDLYDSREDIRMDLSRMRSYFGVPEDQE